MSSANGRSRRGILASGALIGLILLGSLGPGRGATAQSSTPEAMGSPAARTRDCSEVLGVGKAGDACVDIVHASPDAPAVDVYVDGTKAVTDLKRFSATGFVALPAGDHQVEVAPTGSRREEAVIKANLKLEAGRAYEVAAIERVERIRAVVFPVDLAVIGSTTESAIRVIHASPDAPAVDVARKGGEILVENLPFAEASKYLTVPAGTYNLEVRPTGTRDVALDLPNTQIPAGVAISVYAIGTVADKTLTVFQVVAAPKGMGVATPEATPAA